MDKWNDRVRKWEDLASHRGMKVSFDYWGDSELLFKLSQEQHRGKWLFWFNKQLLTIAWMKQRVDEAVKNSGPRYTPEINVEVPIREVFEGVARTPEFFGMFEQFRARLTKSMRRVARGGNDAASQIISVGITKTSDLLRAIDNAVAQRNAEQIDELQTKCEDASRAAWDAIGRLSGLERSDESAKGLPRPHSDSKYSHERYFLRELTAVLSDCVEFCYSGTVRCARSRALLLSGTAGMGKTHLMCDVALSRLARKLPTLLLLGNHFRNTEPITQIAQEILGMQLSKDDFLSALDAAGAAGYGHTLILVDGINEGDGRTLWHKHVAGFLTAIKPYKHIAVALSVRTTYRDLLIPASIPDAELTRVSHPGFAGHEYRATETFFDHYKLKAPSIPLLNPEFDNPQFLKLFCETLVNTGHTEVPRDLPGIAAVFDEFVSSVNNKISAPNIADFDPEDNLVQRAVHGLIDNMAAHGRTWVTRADAKQIVEGILSGRQYSRSLYRFLKDESVIYDDIEPIPKAKPLEVVRFSFERFTDHLLAKLLLDGIASSEQLSQEFKKGGKLFPYFENKRVVYQHKGLLEAMMIEVPEKIGHEVLVVAPQFASETPALDAFFDGILWRHPRTINERTLEQLNKVSGTHPEGSKKCFDLMLLLAATPNHPWNAKFLHRNLLRQSLTERDATWSIYVFDRYKQQGPIDRLIDWASSESAKSHLDDESILLAGIALSWFLTTSHRFVRDHATKALVALFSTRLPLLAALLEEFRSVNDPYVLQRLYAVAYGCAMRSTDHKGIGQLAEKTFELVFAGGTPYPDILLRDYARGVIETALHQNCKLSFDADAARPPYTSEWEDAEFASGELENWSSTKDDMPDRDWNRYHLYQSIMGSEDFARYIIGTNHGSFEWSSQRLKEVKKTKSNERRRRPDEADRFSLKLLQRWILRRVIDLGWTVERFGEFDRRVSHFADVGRGEHKPERIGKKYQWIAYHEALARISDNFVFIGDHWAERNEEYEGPWQVGFVRDIDPSCLIRETMAYRDEVTWWQPLRYDSWELAKSDVAWLKTTADVPDPKSIITVTDSQGVGWVTLEGYPAFEQPLPKYEDRFGVPKAATLDTDSKLHSSQEGCEQIFPLGARTGFRRAVDAGIAQPQQAISWRVFLVTRFPVFQATILSTRAMGA